MGRKRQRGTVRRVALAAVAASVAQWAGMAAAVDEPSRAQTAPADPPNVLLIVTDDQRVDTMSVMPQTRAWFSDGTTYTNAFATTPLCCPARASIFTGRYAHNHDVENNSPGSARDLVQSTTLQSYLHDAGYRTGIFGKYFNSWPLEDDPPHFDRWAVNRSGYYDAKFNVQGTVRRIPTYSTRYIANQAVSFVDAAAKSDDPWFLYLAPTAPHTPFTPARAHADAPVPRWRGNPAVFESDRSDKPRFVRSSQWSFEDGRRQRRLQLRTLMSVDDLVARVARTLEEHGEDDDTLAIFMSDNGFLWGDHGLGDKRFPYDASVRVPMMLRWPGRIPAGVDDSIVANVDVAPTALEAAGVIPEHVVDGRSLLTGVERDRLLLEYAADYQHTEIPSWASLRTSTYQYVEYYDGSGRVVFREHYDLANDPWQLDNVLADGDASDDPDVAALSLELYRSRGCAGATCP